MSGNIYDVVEKQRAALLAKEYQTVKQIVRAYEVAEIKIEGSIRFFQAKIKAAQDAGLQPSLAWYYQEARLENVLREIRGHLEEFSKDALEFASSGRDDAYQLGAVHALRLAEAQVYGDIAGLNAGAFANAQALLSATSPLKALFDEIAPTATVKAREVFAQGIAEGWNPRKLGKVLKSEVDGLSGKRAVLIARTEQIRAYRTANTDVYKKNSDVMRGWRWTAAKTPATCEMCLALDGEIFPVEQTLSSHPACRCSMVPLPKTDFGGPQPSSGEEYFQKLPAKNQDRILGKAKAEMYREGKITLKDNVHWKDHPEWGRQPAPRRVSWLQDKYASKSLPSQRGYHKVSPFEPIPARKLSDLLTEAERKANDPTKKALDAWEKHTLYPSGNRAVDFKRVKAPYKKLVKSLDGLDSTVEEADLKSLVSTLPSAPHEKVVSYIKSLGDGPDLPVVFRQGTTLYIHNGEGLARLQAKLLLGQTKASVRVFDADLLAATKSPIEEASDVLKELGVNKVNIINGEDADVLKALAWAKERIDSTGVVPSSVTVLNSQGSAVTKYGELLIGTGLKDDLIVPAITEAVQQSSLVVNDLKTLQAYGYNQKSKLVRASNNWKENVEASLYRTKFTYDTSEATSKLLTEWGQNRLDLLSLRAFENGQVEDALEEAIILYRRGEYRLGSLPEAIEKPFLKQAETILGKRSTLPAYTDAENILNITIGGQGGSNPGGMFLGKDGIKRYVKFYADEERGLVENIANAIYEKHGIAVPKSKVFMKDGKKAFATEIIDGKTIQALGGIQKVDVKVLEDAFEGYMLDAFLANWDVVGLSADNMMVAGGKVYRIDNGGTFIFRAQGGDKADSILQQFGEFFSLGSDDGKGHTGQFKPILQRLGYPAPEFALKPLTLQAKALQKTLDQIATTEVGWMKFFEETSPGLTEVSKKRMATMMVKRRALLDSKITELEAKAKGISAQKKLLDAQQKAQAQAASVAVKGKAAREASLQKGKRALTQAQFDKILKAPSAKFAVKTTYTSEYQAWLTQTTGADEAMASLVANDPDAIKAIKSYAGSSYNTEFNQPQRNWRKHGTPIDAYHQKNIDDLNRAIAANKKGIKEDVLISRWVTGSNTEAKWHEFTDLDVGTVISDSAFQSTALRPEMKPTGGDVNLHITFRKGERRFIPANRAEIELVFEPNLLYVIKKVEKLKNGNTKLIVEVIPEGYTVPKGMEIRYSLLSFFSRRKKPVDIGLDKITRPIGREGDPVTTYRHSLCANCAHKLPGAAICDAFREGIPIGILFGEIDHTKEVDGDLGIVFEARNPDEDIQTL